MGWYWAKSGLSEAWSQLAIQSPAFENEDTDTVLC